MAFNAGAIVGKMTLDKSQWNQSVSAVKFDQERMKGEFKSFTQSFKDNWLAATAAIYAGMRTINTGWDLIQKGAKAQQVEEGFNAIARSAGIAGSELRKLVSEASGYTTSFNDIAASTSAMIGRSLDASQIVSIMQIARAEARKTGEDVSTAYNTMAGAVTGGFTRALRSAYGLNVDVTLAIENYSRATGLTKEQVERFYKSQAIANEILKQANKDLQSINATMLTHYEMVQQAKAQWQDFTEKIGMGLYNVSALVGSIVGILISGLLGSLELVAQGIAKVISMIPGLKGPFGEVADFWGQKAKANAEAIASYFQQSIASVKDMAGTTKQETDQMLSFTTSGAEENIQIIKQTYDEWLNEMRQNFNAMVLLGQGSFQTLQSGLTDLGMSFLGFGDSIQQTFAKIGQNIIKMLMDIFTQWLAMQLIMGVTKGIASIAGSWGTITGGIGGVNTGMQTGGGIAQSFPTWSPFSADVGIEEVPYTGLYKLHGGEEVVPRYDSTKERGINLTIVNQITSRFVNAAVAEDPDTVLNIINEDTLRRGTTIQNIQRNT